MHTRRCPPATTLTRDQGARFLYPGYRLVAHQDWTRRFSSTILSVDAHFWYKARDHLWWLGKISAHTTTAAHYVVRFFAGPEPVKLKLSSSRHTTAIGAEQDCGAFTLVKVEPVSVEICATSTSAVESVLPTPPRLIDGAGIRKMPMETR